MAKTAAPKPELGIVKRALIRRRDTIQKHIDRLSDEQAKLSGIEAELQAKRAQLTELSAAIAAAD